jgi:hypothetical protein
MRMFSTKPDKSDKTKAKEEQKEKKEEEESGLDAAAPNKGVWFQTKKRLAESILKQGSAEVEGAAETTKPESEVVEEVEMFEDKPVHNLYTIKFNSPILPYSKFPLTQNKYIQQFFKRYSRDRDGVDKLIGVHFANNKNSNAKDAIGIEIELDRSSSNMNVVESKSFKRYKVLNFDETTNFCKVIEFEDRSYKVRDAEGERVEMKFPCTSCSTRSLARWLTTTSPCSRPYSRKTRKT